MRIQIGKLSYTVRQHEHCWRLSNHFHENGEVKMSEYLAALAVAVVAAAIAVSLLGWALRRALFFSSGLFLVTAGLLWCWFTAHGPWAYLEAIATALLGVALAAGAARPTPHRE